MKLLQIAPAPHMRDSMTTRRIMLCVIAALMPAAVSAVLRFGWRALFLMAFCMVFSAALEALCRIAMHREQTVSDCSAALTGLLLAMNLPVTLPLWEAAAGCAAAILLVKQLFGGLGQNFANPAITARIFLMVSAASDMTAWVSPRQLFHPMEYDVLSSATPLVSGSASLRDLFWGNVPGCLGETCAAALLLGGLFLICMGIISPVTPLAFIGSFGAAVLLHSGGDLRTAAYQVLSGGLLLGAFFMATDYATTPITVSGKLVFGIGCGLLTFFIRSFGGYPEGVSFAILLMNILTPYIDRFTMTKPFGAVPRKEAP